MKKILASILALALSVSVLTACGGGSGDNNSAAAPDASSSAQSSSNAIVVGTNPTFAPFEFQNDKGEMQGFDLDLLRAIGEEAGFDVEFKSLSFDALTAAVQNGEIDVIAAGMSITPDRQKQLLFSKPYMDASLGIYVAKDTDGINGVGDLKGKVVAAQQGTTGADEVQDLADKRQIGEAKILEDYNMCFLELTNGGADALVIDLPVAENYMKNNADTVKMVGEPYVADYYGIAMAKDNTELEQKINDGLDKVIKSGKFEELCKKYELPVPQSIIDGTAKVA
ncbi:basic amino acid ABC transporter substrate-binding protein [Peptococcus simiae]|uniref:basic amino acid ABC transporter substrate-binding protein n=1 Tax=Peptococcus simiae TaxID=1643805 RepID=UPI00397F2B28